MIENVEKQATKCVDVKDKEKEQSNDLPNEIEETDEVEDVVDTGRNARERPRARRTFTLDSVEVIDRGGVLEQQSPPPRIAYNVDYRTKGESFIDIKTKKALSRSTFEIIKTAYKYNYYNFYLYGQGNILFIES